MSKQHRIKWRESDTAELVRVVKNYNAKINRLVKKNPQNKNVLPQKVTVADMKELINTRQDLKRELNTLKRFSKRGAEIIVDVPDTDNNIRITKWQKTEMNRRAGIVNRKRKARLELIQNAQVRGEDYTLGQLGMGRQAERELRPIKPFFRTMGQTDIHYKWKSMQTETQSTYFTDKDYALRDNYIKALNDNYNPNDVADIVKSIEDMDINDFMKTFQEVDLNTFEWASGPPEQEQYQGYLTHLKGEWLPNK